LLESVYEIVLAYELQQRRLSVGRQVPIAICYKEMTFAVAFRADIVVDK
jgi:GxxExxY protein